MKQKSKTNSKLKMTFIFEPAAQNTVIRPMAQAVCITHGGETTSYIGTADHKEKVITLSDLRHLMLHTTIKGQKLTLDGYEVASMARHTPLRVRVDVNDVQILVSKETSVTQAMSNFHRKITTQNNDFSRKNSPSHQHE